MADYYEAWEVRTPFTDAETFSEAKRRMQHHADLMDVTVRWRKSKGQRGYNKRFHFWELNSEADAAVFTIACGDKVSKKTYRNKDEYLGIE